MKQFEKIVLNQEQMKEAVEFYLNEKVLRESHVVLKVEEPITGEFIVELAPPQ